MKCVNLSEYHDPKEINQPTGTLRNRNNVRISALNIILILIKILYSEYMLTHHIHIRKVIWVFVSEINVPQ